MELGLCFSQAGGEDNQKAMSFGIGCDHTGIESRVFLSHRRGPLFRVALAMVRCADDCPSGRNGIEWTRRRNRNWRGAPTRNSTSCRRSWSYNNRRWAWRLMRATDKHYAKCSRRQRPPDCPYRKLPIPGLFTVIRRVSLARSALGSGRLSPERLTGLRQRPSPFRIADKPAFHDPPKWLVQVAGTAFER